VEAQIELAQQEVSAEKSKTASAEKLRIDRERKTLELSRSSIQQKLDACQNERYKEQLMQALADLDSKLAGLESETT